MMACQKVLLCETLGQPLVSPVVRMLDCWNLLMLDIHTVADNSLVRRLDSVNIC